MRALLLASLLAAPAAAVAQIFTVPSAGECRQTLQAYRKVPAARILKALLPCVDVPDAALRAEIYDGMVNRVVWDDPLFPGLIPQVRLAADKGQRDHDSKVSQRAFDVDLWLDNAQRYQDEKARAAARRVRQSHDDDASDPVRVQLALIFGAGVVAQVLILIVRSGANLGGLGVALAFGLFGFIPGRSENPYVVHFHVAYCFLLFAFVSFAQYKKQIMARVSESSLLVNNLTLGYLCCAFLGGFRQELVLTLAALPTLLTLIVAFTVRKWSFAIKLACYVWFLVVAAANAAFQVRFGNLAFLFAHDYAPPPAFDLFLTGMVFTILSANLFFVYILIPIADKHETHEHRMMRWREDTHAMVSRFSDYRLTPAQAGLIIALQGGFYAFNQRFGWMPPRVVMDLSIAVLPLALGLTLRRRDKGLSNGRP